MPLPTSDRVADGATPTITPDRLRVLLGSRGGGLDFPVSGKRVRYYGRSLWFFAPPPAGGGQTESTATCQTLARVHRPYARHTGCTTGGTLYGLRADGAVHRLPLPGQCRRLPAQLVLIAIGYARPLTTELLTQLPLRLDAHGRVAANEENYQTNVDAVFSCGDMRRGQSLVVWAIREGRQCARAVDLWLRGYSDLPRV